MKKCIFLSVSGQTPQIITETLFKLREEGREIVDIYVVTTSTGKNNILKCLLGIDPNDGSTVGKNIFIEMSREYGWNEITLNKDKDHLEDFLNSTIALLFIKKATGKTERTKPTEAEWKMMVSQFSKDLPATFKSFGDSKPLSQLEQRICMLLILDIPEYVISIMADTSTSTVSNAKARANYKLFGKKEAYPLKNNLIQSLRRS